MSEDENYYVKNLDDMGCGCFTALVVLFLLLCMCLSAIGG